MLAFSVMDTPSPASEESQTGSFDPDGRLRIGDHVPAGSDLTNAMIHLYRGEMGRSNIWRTRLDATTNWAVITTGAALTFAFGTSAAASSHMVLLVISLLVLLFLFIEARRYRYHELWTHRVRLMETHFFANLLRPLPSPSEGWEERLTDSLRAPRFPISLMEALGRRYRRTYALLFMILGGSWLLKVASHAPTGGITGLVQASEVGFISGWPVLAFWFLFNVGLVALGIFTVGLRQTDAEVFGTSPGARIKLLARLRAATREALEVDLAALRPSFVGGSKNLAWIISDKPEAIGKVLLKDLDRGVTRVRAEGMYSGKEHSLLLSVIQGRQAEKLRELVYGCDPQAFVVILAARDVRGEGFRPLEA